MWQWKTHRLTYHRMTQDRLIHLCRDDLDPATVDHFLDPPGDKQKPVLIEIAFIACMIPVLRESLTIGGGIVLISIKGSLSRNGNLAFLKGRQRLTLAVDNKNPTAIRLADAAVFPRCGGDTRTGHEACLGGTISF